MAGGKVLHDHQEIDDFLARADEVLKDCPTPKISDPSTVTSSGIPGGHPGQKKPGRTKSKSHSDEGPVSQSA